jgi:nucleotide-binding universal stress UspA family protein
MARPRRKRASAKNLGLFKPRHVLLADDGSKLAGRARRFALKLGAATGARLTVAYVREPLEKVEQADRKLRPVLAAARAAGVRCKSLAVEPPVGVTNPGRRIIAAATRVRADMIVVGARGSGMVRRLLGSVSSYVVNRATVSVCVIR